LTPYLRVVGDTDDLGYEVATEAQARRAIAVIRSVVGLPPPSWLQPAAESLGEGNCNRCREDAVVYRYGTRGKLCGPCHKERSAWAQRMERAS
jgi:hypothetical protein